jgi:hypothetical protein
MNVKAKVEEIKSVLAANKLNLIIAILCIALYSMLYAYNVATSPIPTTGVTYDSTTFRGKGIIGGVVNWVTYDYKDKKLFMETDWLGRRSYYYTLDGEERFDYNPVTREWVQTK